MLWVDKYRPRNLEQLTCHNQISELLKRMKDSEEFPHMLFYGPPGAGKKTRVLAFLKEVYGPGAEKLKVETRTFKIPPSNSTSVECQVLVSSYHIEVTPSDAGNKDRVIIQQLIKEIAQSPPLQSTPSFKVVVINEVDRLTREAQAGLRRTMEKYMGSCRILMLCESLAKVLPPVRSRCLCIRVPAPTNQQISDVLYSVAAKESIKVPPSLVTLICQQSGRDLRKAILSLEVAKAQKYPFAERQVVPKAPWEEYIKDIAAEMIKEQSPKKLMEVRNRFYDLLVSCIPGDMIIKALTMELIGLVNDDMKADVLGAAANYEHSMRLGSKEIIHLEAFAARFMSMQKQWILSRGL